MEKLNGAICIVAYNREGALLRILDNILLSDVCDYKIYVSIDYSEEQDKIINKLQTKDYFNRIELIKRDINLGLKEHVLACGDLVNSHDFIVILEDDLIVSKYLKNYINTCLSSSLENIATISLYSYHRSEGDLCSFIPLSSGSDNYFMQFPSSWGQIYTKSMWNNFRNWLKVNDCDMFHDDLLPSYICLWPKSSWKKHFLRYMVHTNKYSIYPYFSLTTNPGEDGTHHKAVGATWQSNLLIEDKNWEIKDFDSCKVIYNSHFCIGDKSKNYARSRVRDRRANDSAFIHLDYLFLFLKSVANYFIGKIYR
ncbi:glycosyltransferase [Vibrio sp. YIC-376]|uniref:glycosyltransferase n=1 Tax=Vibrio sp. YIC-376 TaxID=3136162 RepID=UPI00402AEEFC